MPVANSKAISKKLASIEAEVQKWEQISQICIKTFISWDKKFKDEQKIAKKEKNKEEYKNLEDKIEYLYEVYQRELKGIQTELTSAQKKETWLRLVLTGSRLKPEDQ